MQAHAHLPHHRPSKLHRAPTGWISSARAASQNPRRCVGALRRKCASDDREVVKTADVRNGFLDSTKRLSEGIPGVEPLTEKLEAVWSSFSEWLQTKSNRVAYMSLTLMMEQSSDDAQWLNQFWLDSMKMSVLHVCVLVDHYDCATYLLTNLLVDPNTKTPNGYTPLGFAMARGDSRMVELLIKFGADPNCMSPDGSTPLHFAVSQSQQKLVEWLVEAGANPYQAGADNVAPIFLAVLRSKPDMLECMLSEGGDPVDSDPAFVFSTFKIRQQPVEIKPCDVKYGLLCVAAIIGDLEIVEVVMKYVDKVDFCVNGLTPLAAACCNGHLQVVKFLIECGADPYFSTTLPSPLATAGINGHAAVVEYILRRRGLDKVDVREQFWGLFYAAESGFADVVEVFLKSGLTPNCTTFKLSPMGVAAQNGHDDVVEVLIAHGSFIDGSCDGVHPLFMACHNGHTAVVQRLLKAGANPNTTVKGMSCLYIAVENSHKQIETWLLSYGATQYVGPSKGKPEGIAPSSNMQIQWLPGGPE